MTSASTFSEKEPPSQPEMGPSGVGDETAELIAELQTLPEELPPELQVETVLHGEQPAADDVVIILSQLAIKQVAMHGASDIYREVGGVLLGHAYNSDGRLYLDVRAAIPAVSTDHGPVHFTFTADAWAQLHQDRARRYPDLDIVGWFHTHPDLGVFYSSDDVVVHTAAFAMPWHVGLVVDPLRKETSFFAWKQHTLAALPGFYERLELEPTTILPWQPVATDVWDRPYDYADSRGSGTSGIYLPANSPPAVPGLLPAIGYGLAALGLLLSLLLLFGWVLPLNREVDRLQNMVVVLADSALADSNAAACPDPRLRILSPLVSQKIAVGTTLEIMGTAMIPEAIRYQVDARPAGVEARWATIDQFRGAEKLGDIATWQTDSWPAGLYELRLAAVDNNNIRVPGSPDCVVTVELTS